VIGAVVDPEVHATAHNIAGPEGVVGKRSVLDLKNDHTTNREIEPLPFVFVVCKYFVLYWKVSVSLDESGPQEVE